MRALIDMARVFKFGGGCIKDAGEIRRLIEIVNSEKDHSKLILVISAIGKTTNALEEIVKAGFEGKEYAGSLEKLISQHKDMAKEVCPGDEEILEKIMEVDLEIKNNLNELLNQSGKKFDFVYDQIVSFGEILSTSIILHALNQSGFDAEFLDARRVVFTNARNRNGGVLWEKTQRSILDFVEESEKDLIVTQGFIGSFEGDFITTLGREGSDFSGAIFASCLDSPSLTIWKDVPGIMNGDPKISNPNYVFPFLSYFETSELTYYGAKVIHPKTIKPLANKKIPIHVRSFYEPESNGTIISEKGLHEEVPTLILKRNQALISFTTKNFEFIKSYHLELIFSEVQNLAVAINLTQSSAISFSVVADFEEGKIIGLINSLEGDFHCKYNFDLSLLTIKNYTDSIIQQVEKSHEVLMKQQTRNTCRILIEDIADEKISFDVLENQ